MTPILYTELEMDFNSGCYIKPSLDIMQNDFNNAVLCCTEINLFVSTWGKQAKTQERNDRRVTAGEFTPTHPTVVGIYMSYLSAQRSDIAVAET